MWLKLLCLLLYLFLLFVAARLLETLSWLEPGWSSLPSCTSYSCRLLDPVLMSVVQLKAVLDQRGLSYEGAVEKKELTDLINISGQVSVEEANQSQLDSSSDVETNFTSGAHFIEQVEDAKDSVWVVQVTGTTGARTSHLLSERRWSSLQHKMAKFGVRMGRLDCSLDVRYCHEKGWHSPLILLALPSRHQLKANVAMYNFTSSPVRESALFRWVREKLDERVHRIPDAPNFIHHWYGNVQKSSVTTANPEIQAVLYTHAESAPLFYSALSVKFPGRVRFGQVTVDSLEQNKSESDGLDMLNNSNIIKLPAYIVYTAEQNYTYGYRPGEHLSFASMERFFRILYPSLNDIFIVSFCLANAVCFLEPFVTNCSIIKRLKKFCWCVFKYNLMVILLWLPIIAIFQMPYLDRVPLFGLKCIRVFSLSKLGEVLRGDYNLYMNNLSIVLLSFTLFVFTLAYLSRKYMEEEATESNPFFNFSQMRTLTHLQPNDFFEPMRVGGYDIFGGLDVFGSRVSAPPTLWLPPSVPSDYIHRLPTWTYKPVPLGLQAQAGASSIQAVLLAAERNQSGRSAQSSKEAKEEEEICQHCSKCMSGKAPMSQSGKSGLDNFSSCSYCCKRKCYHPHNFPSTSKPDAHCRSEPSSAGSCSCLITKSNLPESPHRKYGESSHNGKITFCSNCKVNRGKSESYDVTNPTRNYHMSSTSCSNTLPLRPLTPTAPSLAASPDVNPGTSFSASSHQVCCSCHQGTDPPCPATITRPCKHLLKNTNHTNQEQKAPTPSNESQSGLPNSQTWQTTTPQSQHSRAGSGFPPGYLESYQCVICLEEYAPLASLCGLPCGHVFHERCIISWLNTDKHFCPMCRWPSFRPRELSPSS